jgi:hypothetical protein
MSACRSCFTEKPKASEYIEYDDNNFPIYEKVIYKDGAMSETFFDEANIKARLSKLLHQHPKSYDQKSQKVKDEIQNLYARIDQYRLAQLRRDKSELSPDALFRKRQERDAIYHQQYQPRGISYTSFRRNWDDNEGTDSDVGYEKFLPEKKYNQKYDEYDEYEEYEEYKEYDGYGEENDDYESFLD